jgi:hypothetical protein
MDVEDYVSVVNERRSCQKQKAILSRLYISFMCETPLFTGGYRPKPEEKGCREYLVGINK